MAIASMKRLSVIAPCEARRKLIREINKLGCVELEKVGQQQLSDFNGQLSFVNEDTNAAEIRNKLQLSCNLLKEYAPPKKTPLFPEKLKMSEKELFNQSNLNKAISIADEIVLLGEKIDAANSQIAILKSQISALLPWRPLDLPLDFAGTEYTSFHIGTFPRFLDLKHIKAELFEIAPTACFSVLNEDKEQRYTTLIVHKTETQAALSYLKGIGLIIAGFRNVHDTPFGHIGFLRRSILEQKEAKQQAITAISALSRSLKRLQVALDAFTQEAISDNLVSSLPQTSTVVYLTGWVPEDFQVVLSTMLETHGWAWNLRDPIEGEKPPVLMENNRLIDPVVSVTEMYGVPEYDSIIDPNAIMYPFYIFFFGFIMADAAYGILMFLGCWLAIKLMKPEGGLKRMLKLFMHCGITTLIAGALFGGWFADALTVFSSTFLSTTHSIEPLWFNPLSDPMKMLYFSLGLGVLHICTGMALSAWRMIKKGNPMDAVFDVGTWYLIFIGIALTALGSGAGGTTIIMVGVVLLLLTGGRKKKGILGKVSGGLGAVYGVTGYLSDLLSYSRIMALGLSGAVVGQVMNKIGTLAGGGVLGLLLFIVVFIIGHVFNIAISLLGAYVHTSRLQYIEFFGRFFEGGGKIFTPLTNKTKYVNIIREE